MGNVVLEEQNFDIMRWPSTWYEIVEGTAFRGAGQR
jgi:outer membrane protein insertion porin family